jgi:hypothetical protein
LGLLSEGNQTVGLDRILARVTCPFLKQRSDLARNKDQT